MHDFKYSYSDGRLSSYNNELIQDIFAPDVLYGTTRYGGTFDRGVIYKTNKDGSGYSILHNFASVAFDGKNPSGALLQLGMTLYGLTYDGETLALEPSIKSTLMAADTK